MFRYRRTFWTIWWTAPWLSTSIATASRQQISQGNSILYLLCFFLYFSWSTPVLATVGGNTIRLVKSQNISVKLDFLQGSGTKCVNKVSATLLLAVLHIAQLPKQFSSFFCGTRRFLHKQIRQWRFVYFLRKQSINQKIVSKLLKIWVGWGSRIQGSKRHRIPDLSSATMLQTLEKKFCLPFLDPENYVKKPVLRTFLLFGCFFLQI